MQNYRLIDVLTELVTDSVNAAQFSPLSGRAGMNAFVGFGKQLGLKRVFFLGGLAAPREELELAFRAWRASLRKRP